MSILEKKLKSHLENIKKLAKANTVINKEGLTVITKDDPIREETDWNSSIKQYENHQQ